MDGFFSMAALLNQRNRAEETGPKRDVEYLVDPTFLLTVALSAASISQRQR